MIKDEEDALEDYYREVSAEKDEPLSGFSPLINTCASEISSAFSNCWVSVRASRQNENNPEYVVSIQPDNHNTPNDIQLKLKSLGYAPTFKAIRDLESAVWADFEVKSNGITFNLSSTVSEVPELERYDEPATDEELPF